jgi:flagellar basal-body rod protein FlgC
VRFLSALDTSASGLTAQRLRMDVIANNLANVNSTRTAEGGPYRRQTVLFQARSAGAASFRDILAGKLEGGGGVRVVGIAQDPSPFKQVYDPSHPDANAEGYVSMPNVDLVSEMVDMIAASRAYEANVTALNASKSMALKALEIGR